MSQSRFDLVMKLYPPDFRDSHRDEIATTIQDADDGEERHLGIRDAANLAAAGLRIRMRSLQEKGWYPETREGIALGVRIALFVQAFVAASFVQSAVVGGRSVRSGYDYLPAHRLLLAAFLIPWILVFFAQLSGRLRLALMLGGASSVAGVALVYYKLAFDPVGFGPATLYAILLMLIGLVIVRVGGLMKLGRARHPVLTVIAWVAVADFYSIQVNGEFFFLTGPLAVGALAAVLIALGMAIAGRPRGLVAMGVLAAPAFVAGGYRGANLDIIAAGALVASIVVAISAVVVSPRRDVA